MKHRNGAHSPAWVQCIDDLFCRRLGVVIEDKHVSDAQIRIQITLDPLPHLCVGNIRQLEQIMRLMRQQSIQYRIAVGRQRPATCKQGTWLRHLSSMLLELRQRQLLEARKGFCLLKHLWTVTWRQEIGSHLQSGFGGKVIARILGAKDRSRICHEVCGWFLVTKPRSVDQEPATHFVTNPGPVLGAKTTGYNFATKSRLQI